MHLNYEFKAQCFDIELIESKLLRYSPTFHGVDHQTDTYFNCPHGRLKIREGNIENALIFYDRNNVKGTKLSEILLYQIKPISNLKEILAKAMGVKVVIEKSRKIYFIENVKFHFDEVKGLGKFLEVEAIDSDGLMGTEKLKKQCNGYAQLFEISEQDFIAESYSDLLLVKKSSTH